MSKSFLERLNQELGEEKAATMRTLLNNLGLLDNANSLGEEGTASDSTASDSTASNGTGIITLDDPYTLTIENYFRMINVDQLRQIAKRLNPALNVSDRNSVEQDIRKSLESPKRLKAMVAQLSSLELFSLQIVKRYDGHCSGWELIIQAALCGFKAGTATKSKVFKENLVDHPGVALIAKLLRDGVILPASSEAAWFSRYRYGASPVQADEVYVDPRILEHIPDTPPQPYRNVTLGAAAVDSAAFKASAQHPVQTVLELNEVVNLVIDAGGLPLTKSGRVTKTALKRLLKARTWLEPRLEMYIDSLFALGLVKPESAQHYKVDLNAYASFQELPLAMRFRAVLHAYFDQSEEDARSWRNGLNLLHSAGLARRVLIESLALLPEHPVYLDEVLDTLWQDVWQVSRATSRNYGYFHVSEEKESCPTWFKQALTGELASFGLVAVAPEQPRASGTKKNGANKLVLQLAQGFAWYQAGSGELHLDVAKDVTKDAAKDAAKDVHEHVGNSSSKAPSSEARQTALLIQPNFEVIAYLDQLTADAVQALSYMEIKRIDQQIAVLELSRPSIYRALESGNSLDGILQCLETNSTGLAANVRTSLQEWAKKRERLSLYSDYCLLEFASKTERNQALSKLSNARAVAERFIAVAKRPKDLNISSYHNYKTAPKRVIRFNQDGSFQLRGASDLAARAVIGAYALPKTNPSTKTKQAAKHFVFNMKKIQQEGFSASAQQSFTARVEGRIPDAQAALIDIWQGKQKQPSSASIAIFQHAQARALASHPEIAKHLDAPLNPTSYVIKSGAEKALRKALNNLGLSLETSLDTNLKADQVTTHNRMVGLPTRKMREILEKAIGEGRNVELKYKEEKYHYDRYGYSRKGAGKTKTQTLKPTNILYDASIPYVAVQTLEGTPVENIRIGYIAELAVI
jgi:hypothetical protein